MHISQLKKYVPLQAVLEDYINATLVDPMASLQRVWFMASWMIRKCASTVSQIQVQWSDCLASLLAWEEVEDFLHAPLGVKLAFEGEGMLGPPGGLGSRTRLQDLPTLNRGTTLTEIQQ